MRDGGDVLGHVRDDRAHGVRGRERRDRDQDVAGLRPVQSVFTVVVARVHEGHLDGLGPVGRGAHAADDPAADALARLTRAGMLEVMRSDYIRTARAKGLSEETVLLKHGLRGGIIPVVSFTGPALAGLLAGTVVVERVFAIPGLGNIFIQAVLNRDEPLILGIVAFLSILIMVFNLIVDISYGYLDPRIRYE